MKRNDIILIIIILVFAAAGLLFMNFTKKDGDMVVVKVDGKVYKELPLNKDTTFEITGVRGGRNLLVIKDGHADVVDATCPDKLCVNQRQIDKDGETIVCLPNKVVVEIESSKESDVDAVAQ
ncbi:NusG domain II-containing protein [Anaerocolumna sp. MB42-C2]|uniref:NusG domain II-containing protein n=1 Tax=Anaerocolumna sp. MB42-C2 TaxID=3070997 RepID=UPI0027E0B878|nr:NusG domain II-containing protein [Anaerocolumna sp. MB42-C2]WMJ85695.1 NusG domain II-containing protein [Anaerocolumna sp. MB42-C2]